MKITPDTINPIILFRFDRRLRICQNHLKHIQYLNPGVPIHGIYGGTQKDFHYYEKGLNKYFTSIYFVKNKSAEWKWKNFDLILREWYVEQGNLYDFSMAYVIEWDLLLTDSIKTLYGHIKNNELGLTRLIPLSKVEKMWDWTSKEPYASQWLALLSFVKKHFSYNQVPHASLGPGLCVPKEFLKKYSEIDVPDLVHDEIRIPLFAQILGFTLKDTGFCKAFFSKEEYVFFNCNGSPRWFITPKTVLQERKKADGRKVFHPYRTYVSQEMI